QRNQQQSRETHQFLVLQKLVCKFHLIATFMLLITGLGSLYSRLIVGNHFLQRSGHTVQHHDNTNRQKQQRRHTDKHKRIGIATSTTTCSTSCRSGSSLCQFSLFILHISNDILDLVIRELCKSRHQQLVVLIK